MLITNMVLGTDYPYPKLQIRTNFVPILKFAPKIWDSQQMEHANHEYCEYNTRNGLERLRDYWLKIIIGRKIRLKFRT